MRKIRTPTKPFPEDGEDSKERAQLHLDTVSGCSCALFLLGKDRKLFIGGDPEGQALASGRITGYSIQAAEIEPLNLICLFHFCPPDPWSMAVERGHV